LKSPPQLGPVPLGRAHDALDPILAYVGAHADVAWASPAGGVRRGADLVDDVALVVACHRPAAVLAALSTTFPDRAPGRMDADTLTIVIDRVPVEVTCVGVERAGTEMVHRTGSRKHLAALQLRAHGCGLILGRTGLRTQDGETRGGDEAGTYRALGLPFIPPELRNGTGEVEAAHQGTLPALVSLADIRGDLHTHTHWSDGRDSVDAMARAASALGYEYLAITDHSPNSAAVRNLTVDGVARQAEEIAALREAHPHLTILHGCEADILEDGTLDFPDRVLEQFDLVLASLHEPYAHTPATLLRRYELAMRHPLVTLVTHPTNRLVPHRGGYDLDYDRLFQLALDTGTLLEIDGAPSHLDLDASLARRAVDAGVMLAIDSDCHRADKLGRQMHLGVLTARRGWVEPSRVVNTRPVESLLAYLGAKRSGRTPHGVAC